MKQNNNFEYYSIFRIFWGQLKSPFIYLLIIIALIQFVFQEYSDAFIILAIVIINAFFGFYQEYRTNNSLKLLKNYLGDKIKATKEGKEVELKTSMFTRELTRFSKFTLYLMLITTSCVFLAHLLIRGADADVLNLIIFSMALAISIIPEALPAVISFALARGAINLSKYKVIVKKLMSVEDLGSMQLLCIDKLPVSQEAVQESLNSAKMLGVDIKIISCDTKEANLAVAKQISLITTEDQIITGEEFGQLSGDDKLEKVKFCSVFAHVSPEQKGEIINLLRIYYDDIGYLGECITDLPALKASDVAIAVSNAADIVREEADIILLHKSLGAIIDGIHQGRIVFANMVKYIKTSLTPNFGHFYSLSLISLLVDFSPILPSQLLLINLLTDLPMIAISTDNVDIAEINKPKKYDLKDIALITIILGLIVMVADFIIFILFYDKSIKALQTSWFISSILIELSFFYSIRTALPFYKAPRPSKAVATLSFLIGIVSVALPFTNFGQNFLHFEKININDLSFIFALVIVYFLVTDYIKVKFYKKYLTNTFNLS